MQKTSENNIDQFRERGFLRLREHLPAALCEDVCAEIWQRLEKQGFRQSEPDTWSDAYSHGFKLKRIRRSIQLEKLYTNEIRTLAENLLNEPIAREDKQNLLLTFPDSVTRDYVAESGLNAVAWHTDCPRIPNVGSPGMIVLTFLNDVVPGGGGTYILAGSHRIGDAKSSIVRSKQLKRYLNRCELFKQLTRQNPDGTVDFRGKCELFDGVRLEVVELSGKTGDVVMVDGRMLHAIASNKTDTPRLMSRGFFFTRSFMAHYSMGQA